MFKVTISRWDEFQSLIRDHAWFETFEAAFEFTCHQFDRDVKIYDEFEQLMHHRNIKGEIQVESYA